MMRFSRYAGTPNIGVYAVANESFAFIAGDAAPEFVKDVEEALQVKTQLMTVAGSFVIGSLVVMNSNGAVVSGLADPREVEIINSCLPCTLIDDPLNAAGNNILANDKGAIVNPEYTDEMVKVISDGLGVECLRASIAGINTVGSICRATNIGCVCHADASDDEMQLIQDVLKVEPIRTTVNHGVRMVGAGILANSKGALIGDDTTPIEMGKIEEGLALCRLTACQFEVANRETVQPHVFVFLDTAQVLDMARLQVLRHVQVHQYTACCRYAERHLVQTEALERTHAP